ncbi:hypothetical protein FJ444_17700 [Aestuariibacter sp. GS-14]|uniref:hypothetical protein n=1 Tax=Aestuariibacter sp. GS-14 TaxID=2590670 RepID=UPI00112E3B4E|nr:hypothetical protein [Aestuariibacter sp. GS-14]TPV55093.1 hypothetical protein FJ444_17700 [Aestuariibacter sp. GS-14]
MFRRLLFIILLVLLVGVIGLAFLTLDQAPIVTRESSKQVDNADTVKELLRQLKNSVEDRHAQQQVHISQSQFESLMGFAQRALPGFQGAVDIAPHKTLIQASMALPAPANSLYINVTAQVFPADGVDIDYVRVGSLIIPGETALNMAVWLVDKFTKSDVASTAANQITRVTMTDSQLTLDMRPLDELLAQIDVARGNISSGEDPLGDLTTDYLAYLDASPLGNSPTPQTLAKYLNLVLSRAASLSGEDDAVLHNQAALLSLAIYLGDHRISQLVGASHPTSGEIAQPRAPAVLAQRNDLAKHFTISAAIQILSQQNMTLAIGEFKELMDRAMGGSGYSFVDLAADMSGMAFGRVASEATTATQVQVLAEAHFRERDILPYIGGLPEGLSKAEFRRRYSEVDSPAYREQVADIQQRIDKLPLYRLGAQ